MNSDFLFFVRNLSIFFFPTQSAWCVKLCLAIFASAWLRMFDELTAVIQLRNCWLHRSLFSFLLSLLKRCVGPRKFHSHTVSLLFSSIPRALMRIGSENGEQMRHVAALDNYSGRPRCTKGIIFADRFHRRDFHVCHSGQPGNGKFPFAGQSRVRTIPPSFPSCLSPGIHPLASPCRFCVPCSISLDQFKLVISPGRHTSTWCPNVGTPKTSCALVDVAVRPASDARGLQRVFFGDILDDIGDGWTTHRATRRVRARREIPWSRGTVDCARDIITIYRERFILHVRDFTLSLFH